MEWLTCSVTKLKIKTPRKRGVLSRSIQYCSIITVYLNTLSTVITSTFLDGSVNL
ncbi:MAG: hypothetical protein ACI9VO_001831 [Colwellia sp.]|jgi:hypothetical protein